MSQPQRSSEEHERLKRWRLVLGADSEPEPDSGHGLPGGIEGLDVQLEGDELQMDKVLQALYDSDRKSGLGKTSPKVNRWLGDIRTYFSSSNVRMMQKDALERLKLHKMLLEPETLEHIEADVHLVGTLVSLKGIIPQKTKETARKVVRKVVDEIERKLRNPLLEAVRGALSKVTRSQRPRSSEIDWDRTIRKNLRNYLPEQKTIIPERLVGYGRKQSSLRDIILCVDQSGSMATSVVYSSIFAAVLASMRAVSTKLVVFDTEIADLTELLQDPVDVLFGAQLGGGTDINRAVGYCQQLVERPDQTIMVIITDLYEGGDVYGLLGRIARLVASGVTVVCLLSLSDDGAPMYNDQLAANFAELGVPAFACTPDLFPDLMASAIQKQDLNSWAAMNNIVVRGHEEAFHHDESSSMS
ncbi:VWA domain-containing protein [Thalassoglobus polymorphus]|uniref:VWA domain containing CoxE-like protein n=1 Tax=Thalassoglobus polymorphus TaxID=2527994 RepID=A0A517QM59_9PLAN|nr:VWA domain-containing protein [Thalassoglobus polymorphus]QDT32724.1 VWA domain containing CoxE-like protein [Thalassoglobus polymorphus]